MTAAEIAILISARNTARNVLREVIGDVGDLEKNLGVSKVAAVALQGAFLGLGIAGAQLALQIAKLPAEVAKASAAFEYQMTIIRNNTTMSNRDFAGMVDSVKALASATGSSTQQIAEGYRHATNLGFDMADSEKIVAAANQLATATGSDVADTTNRIAGIMKEFGVSADNASAAENTMFMIAAQGNMTFQELADYSGRLNAVTGALGGSLTDMGAAMDALTRHGFSAAQAQTQLLGIITHMVNPTKSARAELQKLDSEAGTNLAQDFSLAGLQTKGLSGIMDELRVATAGNTSEIFKLVPAIRGGQGAVTLMTTGTMDYKRSLSDLNSVMAGESEPAQQALQRELNTTEGAGRILQARMGLLKVAVGEGLSQGAGIGIRALIHLGDAFEQLGARANAVMSTTLPGGMKVGDLLRVSSLGAEGALGEGIAAIAGHFGIGAGGTSASAGQFSSGDIQGRFGRGLTGTGSTQDEVARRTLIAAKNQADAMGEVNAANARAEASTAAFASMSKNELQSALKSNTAEIDRDRAHLDQIKASLEAHKAAGDTDSQAVTDLKDSQDAYNRSLAGFESRQQGLNAALEQFKGTASSANAGVKEATAALNEQSAQLAVLKNGYDQAKSALDTFHNAQLKGTAAFSQRSEAAKERTNALELQITQRELSGAKPGSAALKGLETSLARARLQEQLISEQEQAALGPQKFKINQAFDKATKGPEMTFKQIIDGMGGAAAIVAAVKPLLTEAEGGVKAQRADVAALKAAAAHVHVTIGSINIANAKDQQDFLTKLGQTLTGSLNAANTSSTRYPVGTQANIG